jgi:hypothetical protein
MIDQPTTPAPSNEALAERIERAMQSVRDLEKQMQQRFESVDRATTKQEHADDYNKAQQNEWRKALGDLGDKMAPKSDLFALRDRVIIIDQLLANLPTRKDNDQRFGDMSDRVSKIEVAANALPDRDTLDRRFNDMAALGKTRDERLSALEQKQAVTAGQVAARTSESTTRRANVAQSIGMWGIIIAIAAVLASIATSVIVHNSMTTPILVTPQPVPKP